MNRIHKFFFSLLLIFLPTQLGYHVWPDWATVLGRRIDYLSPTIYFTDVLIFFTLFFWCIELLSRIMKKEKIPFDFFSIQFSVFSILFCFMAGLNIFFAANRPVAIYAWIKFIEFMSLGFYVIKTRPSEFMIQNSLFIGVFYSSLLVIAQFMFQHSIGGPLWWLGERTFNVDTPGIARIAIGGQEVLRPYATFPHPNVLGGYLAALLPLLIYRLLKFTNVTNGKKIFYGSTTFLGLIALALTFSRSAIVVGGIAMMAAIMRMLNSESRITNKFKRKLLFCIQCSLFSVLILFFFIVVARIHTVDESVVIRQELNVAAMKIWRSSPIVGVGLGNFLIELPKVLPTRSVYFLQPVHNIYLLLLSQVGVVGIGFILLFVVKQLKHESRIMNISVFSMLALGLVDHYPLTLQQGQLLLTILLALSL
ncbi:O-antigen ligase family protein [Candidatus Gottesmanbacteria bacterium]|nr:O-antigen ligase family protein [Candidatus Gottesmanbacteria bacterium]